MHICGSSRSAHTPLSAIRSCVQLSHCLHIDLSQSFNTICTYVDHLVMHTPFLAIRSRIHISSHTPLLVISSICTSLYRSVMHTPLRHPIPRKTLSLLSHTHLLVNRVHMHFFGIISSCAYILSAIQSRIKLSQYRHLQLYQSVRPT
jgi:hypothetical protein